MKPSTASLMPAIKKTANATSIWLDTMAQTMIGTNRMRPKVMMFGILTRRFPAPGLTSNPARLKAEPVDIYIV